MPTINIYYDTEDNYLRLKPLVSKLKEFIADKLSGSDIKLTSGEVSIRFLAVHGNTMIGKIELEITAHAFKERIDRQDDICREVRDYIMKEVPEIGDVRVWLKLHELGHSW